jgi:hypothetical protein
VRHPHASGTERDAVRTEADRDLLDDAVRTRVDPAEVELRQAIDDELDVRKETAPPDRRAV